MPESPAWYDESKLRKVYIGENERGWVVDLGDGTCHLANSPINNMFGVGAKWGDRVKLLDDSTDPETCRPI